MKKIILTAAIVFLSPLAAFADSITLSPSTYSDPSQDGIFSNTLVSNQGVIYGSDGLCKDVETPGSPADGSTFSSYTTFTPMVYDNTYTGNNPPTVFHILTMASGYSGCSDAPATYSAALSDPAFVSDEAIYLNILPSQAIDAAIQVATTSFKNTYGFDLDQATAWMWDNLGQPMLGSAIGTIVVMKWYWLGFIAFGIVIFFAFSYFRFFKK